VIGDESPRSLSTSLRNSERAIGIDRGYLFSTIYTGLPPTRMSSEHRNTEKTQISFPLFINIILSMKKHTFLNKRNHYYLFSAQRW
jgi:hypothetical protein